MTQMAKKTRLDELRAYAKDLGITVHTWSPGDGTTRYRFFDKPGEHQSYFGPSMAMYTALGRKDAWNYLYGGDFYRPSKLSNVHARKKKLTPAEAKRLLESEGVDVATTRASRSAPASASLKSRRPPAIARAWMRQDRPRACTTST
jgi:hypothetical protein